MKTHMGRNILQVHSRSIFSLFLFFPCITDGLLELPSWFFVNYHWIDEVVGSVLDVLAVVITPPTSLDNENHFFTYTLSHSLRQNDTYEYNDRVQYGWMKKKKNKAMHDGNNDPSIHSLLRGARPSLFFLFLLLIILESCCFLACLV